MAGPGIQGAVVLENEFLQLIMPQRLMLWIRLQPGMFLTGRWQFHLRKEICYEYHLCLSCGGYFGYPRGCAVVCSKKA